MRVSPSAETGGDGGGVECASAYPSHSVCIADGPSTSALLMHLLERHRHGSLMNTVNSLLLLSILLAPLVPCSAHTFASCFFAELVHIAWKSLHAASGEFTSCLWFFLVHYSQWCGLGGSSLGCATVELAKLLNAAEWGLMQSGTRLVLIWSWMKRCSFSFTLATHDSSRSQSSSKVRSDTCKLHYKTNYYLCHQLISINLSTETRCISTSKGIFGSVATFVCAKLA